MITCAWLAISKSPDHTFHPEICLRFPVPLLEVLPCLCRVGVRASFSCAVSTGHLTPSTRGRGKQIWCVACQQPFTQGLLSGPLKHGSLPSALGLLASATVSVISDPLLHGAANTHVIQPPSLRIVSPSCSKCCASVAGLSGHHHTFLASQSSCVRLHPTDCIIAAGSYDSVSPEHACPQ